MKKTMIILAAMSALVVVVVMLVGMAFGETPTISTFTDKRDGKTYKRVTIGTQTWMAENLNYDVPNVKTDVCNDNKADNCAQYGRLYDWKTALNACPAGWHLPTDDEWTTLTNYVGKNAGTKLKSSTGWNSSNRVPFGTDDYGFSALPGGYGSSAGSFDSAGYYGYWWSATEDDASYAWRRNMDYGSEYVGRNYRSKGYLFSVRCVAE